MVLAVRGAVLLVAHQGAEVPVVVLQLLLEEGDGGRLVEDDPGLRGCGALAAAVRAAHRWDVGGPGTRREERIRIRNSTQQ